MAQPLILSLFPGIGLLDMAFEQEGFCVVRGPDVLWGGDIKRFHPPVDVFDGVIGGPPCQAFSRLSHLVRANGYAVAENLIPEFERCVEEGRPFWYLMENVEQAPIPQPRYYWPARTLLLNNRWLGESQNRKRRFSFGLRESQVPISLDVSRDVVPMAGQSEPATIYGGRMRGSPDTPAQRRAWRNHRKPTAQIVSMACCPVHEYDRWMCGKDCENARREASRAANALTAFFRRRGMRQL